MAIVKKHHFVEIEYTGSTKGDGAVFDTTEEEVAKENGIYDKNMEYSPSIICLGENKLLKALEDQIIGKETEKDYIFEISPEQGFGERDPKLVQLIPMSKFRHQNIHPIPGLQLNIDGVFGVVKSVSGGRCLVDFNHPLAGKELVYRVNIKRVVDDTKEKLDSLLNAHLHTKSAQTELKEDSVSITLKQGLPAKSQEELKSIVARTIPDIKNIYFTIPEEKK